MEQDDQTVTSAKQSFTTAQPGFLTLLIPTKEYLITPIIIAVNVVVFILMIVSGVDIMQPSSEDLLTWGADYRPMTLDGQWWRLLTACFLHIGIIHLLLNMYALLSIGYLLERVMGKKDFLIAYLLTGLASSATSVWWHENTVSAGASGAIFGMYGIFLALLTTNLIDKEEREAQLKSILIFIGYNLLYGIKGGVDNSAHIGGLLSGIIFGYGFYYLIKNRENSRTQAITLAAMLAVVVLYSVLLFSTISNDIPKFVSKVESFQKTEEQALLFYNLPKNSQTATYLKSLKTGIDLFSKEIPELKKLDELELPIELQQKNKLLQQYCQQRIRVYKLFYSAIAEDSDKYNQEIEEESKKIDDIIKTLDNI